MGLGQPLSARLLHTKSYLAAACDPQAGGFVGTVLLRSRRVVQLLDCELQSLQLGLICRFSLLPARFGSEVREQKRTSKLYQSRVAGQAPLGSLASFELTRQVEFEREECVILDASPAAELVLPPRHEVKLTPPTGVKIGTSSWNEAHGRHGPTLADGMRRRHRYCGRDGKSHENNTSLAAETAWATRTVGKLGGRLHSLMQLRYWLAPALRSVHELIWRTDRVC